jgi:hypothetical protein
MCAVYLLVVVVIPLLLKRGARRAGYLKCRLLFSLLLLSWSLYLEKATPHPNPLPQGAREYKENINIMDSAQSRRMTDPPVILRGTKRSVVEAQNLCVAFSFFVIVVIPLLG